MDKSEVARLATELVDGVMCDGFDGYFFNSDDDPAAAIKALESIGAVKTADIVRRACARFPDGMPPANRFARQDVLLDTVAPPSLRANPFATEDEALFGYPEDVVAMVEAYINAE